MFPKISPFWLPSTVCLMNSLFSSEPSEEFLWGFYFCFLPSRPHGVSLSIYTASIWPKIQGNTFADSQDFSCRASSTLVPCSLNPGTSASLTSDLCFFSPESLLFSVPAPLPCVNLWKVLQAKSWGDCGAHTSYIFLLWRIISLYHQFLMLKRRCFINVIKFYRCWLWKGNYNTFLGDSQPNTLFQSTYKSYNSFVSHLAVCPRPVTPLEWKRFCFPL